MNKHIPHGPTGNRDKITRVSVVPILLPRAKPMKMAGGLIANTPIVLVTLETSAGVQGRSYVFSYVDSALRPLHAMIEEMAAMVVGTALQPLEIEKMLRGTYRFLGATGLIAIAIAAIDMAVWDAFARAADLPLFRALGAQGRPLRAYASFGMETPEATAELAAQAAAAGYTGIKIKAGYPTLAEDLAVVRAARNALPNHVSLMLDYNQSLSLSEAEIRCAALDNEGLSWIEEPILQEDHRGHAKLAAAMRTPIQLGENWFSSREMADAIEAGACDLAMPDLMKIGGVTGWLTASQIAATAAMPISSHLFHEVSAHVLCATPGADWLEYLPLADPLLQEPLPVINGTVTPHPGPGTGLAWNEEAVKAYRADR
ncbi:MAG: mandelate racemase [Rhodospirillaceae bacterium]|nr:MAG: mandelate racemase [Rhodospirillaceae bacterium]